MNAKDTSTTTNESIPSRRTVLGAGGAVGLTLLNPGSIFAQGADAANTIRVGFMSPRTGRLASFGEADGYVLELARNALKEGLTAGGKKYAVEILDRDTQSDPSRASQLAKTLINVDKVDLMLVTSAPETVNPVADACEGLGVPCLSTIAPWEAWYFGRGAKPGEPSPFKWTFHFSFGVGDRARAGRAGGRRDCASGGALGVNRTSNRSTRADCAKTPPPAHRSSGRLRPGTSHRAGAQSRRRGPSCRCSRGAIRPRDRHRSTPSAYSGRRGFQT